MMEGDYDFMYTDAHEDVNYYDDHSDFDDYPFCSNFDDRCYDDSDAADDYYDGNDVMTEDFNEREDVNEEHVNDDASDRSTDRSDDNMSEVYAGSEGNTGDEEDSDGSDGFVHESSREVESNEDDDSDHGSSMLEDAAQGVLRQEVEDEEVEGDNQSDASGGSEQDIFTDAQNGNYDSEDDPSYPESDDYEDMVDEYDGDEDIWDGDFVGPAPWEPDDTWDDVAMGDQWDEYYDGDEVWDEDTNNGRFQLRYEDYGEDAIPTGDGFVEARDPTPRDNFLTCVVEAGDQTPLGNVQSSEATNRSCPICLEQLDAQEVGNPWNCRHYFCINCILEWVRRSNTCPVDREIISKIAVHCRVGSPVRQVVYVSPVMVATEEA